LVLDDRIEAAAQGMDGEIFTASGALLLDLVPGRVVMFGRADCKSEFIDDWAGLIDDEIVRIAEHGIGADEVRNAKERIGALIESGFDDAEFWASRLAMVSERGGDVESIWNMPRAYRELDAAEVNRVFRRWYRDGEYIRVDLVGKHR
jgi:predicted Zn-dependent peptidase